MMKFRKLEFSRCKSRGRNSGDDITHVLKMLGKTKIKVKDEKVEEVGEPRIKYCPLFDKVRGIKEMTSEVAAGNMEFRIEKHGMFSPRRKLDIGIFVGFGASETIMTGIEKGLIDTASHGLRWSWYGHHLQSSSRPGNGRLYLRHG
jgi:hypothetical protein